jgi:polar amino acid transport system permease protein
MVTLKIVVPQALRLIIPALGNSINGLLKATSLTSVISMEEIMRRSQTLMQVKFDVLEVYAAAGVYYLLLTTLWDLVQRRLEGRFSRGYGETVEEGAHSVQPLVVAEPGY